MVYGLLGLVAAISMLLAPAWAESHLKTIRETHVLRVGTTGDYEPFSFLNPDTQAYEGRDIDAAIDLAKTLHVDVTFVKTSWPTLLADLKADRFDIGMGGISITPTRLAVAAFSDPYLHDGKVPLVRCADQARYSVPGALNRPGLRVVENPGGTNEATVRELMPKALLVLHPQNEALFQRLLVGQSDVMITDLTEAQLQADRHEGLCVVNADKPLKKESKGYLLPKGDPDFLKRVNSWLKKYKKK